MPIISIILGLLKNWRVVGAIGLAVALLAGYGYVKHLQKARDRANWEAAQARGQLEINDKKAAIDKEVQTKKGEINELEKTGDADGLSQYFNRGMRPGNSPGKAPGGDNPRSP